METKKQIAMRCRRMCRRTHTMFGHSLVICVAVLYLAYITVYALANKYL